jgi:hypothetical protein
MDLDFYGEQLESDFIVQKCSAKSSEGIFEGL